MQYRFLFNVNNIVIARGGLEPTPMPPFKSSGLDTMTDRPACHFKGETQVSQHPAAPEVCSVNTLLGVSLIT